MQKYSVYIVSGVLLVAVGGWALLQNVSKSSGPVAEGAMQTPGLTSEGSGTMADLVSRGGSWKCDVSYKAPTGNIQGVTYVSGGKIRADFDTTVPNIGAMHVHMIADEHDAYTWTSLMKTGFKMALSAPKTAAASPEKQDLFHQQYSYRCSAWTVDSTVFVLPSDITFNDMNAAVGASDGTKAPVEGPNCSACDMIPDASAKAQCKSALHCK